MSTARITASAPILLVKDVQKAAEHYRDALGFTFNRFWGDPPNFCIVHRDGHHVFLRQVSDSTEVVPHWKVVPKTNSIYFWVDDAEVLYTELKSRGATIDWELYTAAYGVKEFGIQDVDGHDIAFGQILEALEGA